MPKIYLFSQYKNVSDEVIEKFANHKEAYPLAENAHRKFFQLKEDWGSKDPSKLSSTDLTPLKTKLSNILNALTAAEPQIETKKDKCLVHNLLAMVYLFRCSTSAQLKERLLDLEDLSAIQDDIDAIRKSIAAIIDTLFDEKFSAFFMSIQKLSFEEPSLLILDQIIFCLTNYSLTQLPSEYIFTYLESLHRIYKEYPSASAQITIPTHIDEILAFLMKIFSNSNPRIDKTEEVHKAILKIHPDNKAKQIEFLTIAATNQSIYALDQLIEIFSKDPKATKKLIAFTIFKLKLLELNENYPNVSALRQQTSDAIIKQILKNNLEHVVYLLVANIFLSSTNNKLVIERWEKLIIKNNSIWDNVICDLNIQTQIPGVTCTQHTSTGSGGQNISYRFSIANKEIFQLFLLQQAILLHPFAATSMVAFCFKHNLIGDTEFNQFLKALENCETKKAYEPVTNRLHYAAITKFFAHTQPVSAADKLKIATHALAISTRWPKKENMLADFAYQLMLEYDIDCLLKSLLLLQDSSFKTSIVSQAEQKYIHHLLQWKSTIIQVFLEKRKDFLHDHSEMISVKELSALLTAVQTPITKTAEESSWIIPISETLINPEKWQQLLKIFDEDIEKFPENKDLVNLKQNFIELNEKNWKALAQIELDKLEQQQKQEVEERKESKMEEKSSNVSDLSPTP